MKNSLKNFAFIDGQNLNLGIKELGWKLDFKRFRIYLKEKFQVTKAYFFIGYISQNKKLYQMLKDFGYDLVFKEIIMSDQKLKGNVDAELVLKAVSQQNHYDKAVLVTSDGDFACLVIHLKSLNKFYYILTPNYKKCSVLLKKAAQEKLLCLSALRHKLEYKK